jgi:DNA-directed RNA polymerase specialized sigma24 family protein
MNPSLEKELLNGAKRLDPKALAAIYDRYNTVIYAYSMRLLGEADLAEDCVAETLSRFLHALHAGADAFISKGVRRLSVWPNTCEPSP